MNAWHESTDDGPNQLIKKEWLEAMDNKLLLRAFDGVSDIIISLDHDYRILYVNQNAEDLLGGPAEAFKDKSLWDLVPDLKGTIFSAKLDECVKNQKPCSFEGLFPQTATWHCCRCLPSKTMVLVIISNISLMKKRELVEYDHAHTASQVQQNQHGFFDILFNREASQANPETQIISESLLSLLGIHIHDTRDENDLWLGRIPPEDLRLVRKQLKSFLEGDKDHFEFECRIHHLDGRLIWLLCRGVLARDEQKRPTRWSGITIDITRIKEHAEMRLELASIVDASDAAIMRCTPSGKIINWNRGAKNIYGYAAKEIEGKEYSILLPPHRDGKAPEFLEKLRNGESLQNTVHERVRKNGDTIYVSCCMTPIKDEKGRVTAVSLVEHDITSERRIQDALRKNENRFRAIFDQAAVGIAQLNFEGKLLRVNERTCQYFKMDREDLLQKNLRDLAHPDDRGNPAEHIGQLLIGKRTSYTREMHCRDSEGKSLWINLAVSLVHKDDQEPDFLLAIIQDITPLKNTETELKETFRRLNELNKKLELRVEERTKTLEQKQRVLRELMTELTLTEQRERRRLASDLHDYIPQLLVASKMKLSRLGRFVKTDKAQKMVEDISHVMDEALKYTRTLIANLSPTVLYEFGLSAAVQQLAEQMAEYEIAVDFEEKGDARDLPEDLAIFAYQGIRELLHNTAKHSLANKAEVILDWREDELLAHVRDDGIGFDPHTAHKTENGQSKFGLFNIRERLESQGGAFHVESAEGEGVHSTMRIPLVPQEELQEEEAGKDPLKPESDKRASKSKDKHARIGLLVVDDHQMIREGLRSMIEVWDEVNVCGEAMDGEEAVALCLAHRPDVILMDVKMPRMNGVEATRIIKKQCPDTVILGLSTHTEREIANTMVAAGAYDFLEKDIDAEELREIINRVAKNGDK
ncbi:MAG: PAS domain S-box protein [Candidatus Sumerlaeia bacterium]